MEFIASLPREAYEAIQNSIQSAHIVAEQFPEDISELIISGTGEAFTSGMNEAMLIGAIVMGVAAVITLFILPNRIRPPQEE
jgi:hypothetical protein